MLGHLNALSWVTLCKCCQCDLCIVRSNAFFQIPYCLGAAPPLKWWFLDSPKASMSSLYLKWWDKLVCWRKIRRNDFCLAFLPSESSKWSFQKSPNPKWRAFPSPLKPLKFLLSEFFHLTAFLYFLISYFGFFHFLPFSISYFLSLGFFGPHSALAGLVLDSQQYCWIFLLFWVF